MSNLWGLALIATVLPVSLYTGINAARETLRKHPDTEGGDEGHGFATADVPRLVPARVLDHDGVVRGSDTPSK